MEVKTRVGVQVEVRPNGSSKVMSFDKPVRLIELTRDESRHIGRLLTIDAKTGITAELRKLIIKAFFSTPKSFRNIREELRKQGVEAKSASLNTILSKMVERKELTRAGTRGAYLYQASEEED